MKHVSSFKDVPTRGACPRTTMSHRKPMSPREIGRSEETMPPGEACRPKEIETEVLEQRRVSEAGFLLTLVAAIPAPQPGQFVMLGLPRGASPFLRRPFSVLEFDPKEKKLQIYYSVSGCGTRILSGVGPGERLGLLGPLGRPFPHGSREIEVMVGGGRGVSPLVFLSRKRSRSKRVLFLVGAACEEEVVLLDKIGASRIFVSTEDGSLGKKGTVLDLLDGAASSPDFDWARATLYGCGPAGMLRSLHEFSLEYKVPCFVSLEARMGCGIGVCQGCAVRAVESDYSLVCKDGPVFSSVSIDWDSYAGVELREFS
jgi:dihydroorotate dehydrogenase electron transfer subunit